MSQYEDSRRRQENPGGYALLHANGMRFPDLVQLISTDAVIVHEGEPLEGDGHGVL